MSNLILPLPLFVGFLKGSKHSQEHLEEKIPFHNIFVMFDFIFYFLGFGFFIVVVEYFLPHLNIIKQKLIDTYIFKL